MNTPKPKSNFSVKVELEDDQIKQFKIKLISEDKTISTKLKELILQYIAENSNVRKVENSNVPPIVLESDPIAPDLVSVEAISVKVDMAATADKWESAALEGGEVIVPISKPINHNLLHIKNPLPAPAKKLLRDPEEKSNILKAFGLNESIPKPIKPMQGNKVKRKGDMFYLFVDGQPIETDDPDFDHKGIEYDLREVPSTGYLMDLDNFQIRKSDQVELHHSDQVPDSLIRLNLNKEDMDYMIAEYMQGDDVTQPAPAEPIELDFLKNILPVDERK